MDEKTETEELTIPAGPLDGTVRALVAAVQRLAEENLHLRGLLESINVRVEEPDGGVLEVGVERVAAGGEQAAAEADRARLAQLLFTPGIWTTQDGYELWLGWALNVAEDMATWASGRQKE